MVIHFIKKIWSGEFDEQVHSQFIRFSRGRFENRTVINIRQGKKIKLNSTFEIANELVLFLINIAQTFSVSGIFLSRQNPESLFKEFGIKADVKKKGKLFQTELNTGLTSEQLKKITGIAYCMLFNMHSEGIELKTKKRLPKPGKSSQEKIDDKFCILELDEKFFPELHEEFLFDMPKEFKKVRISHTYEISNIILPEGEKDYEQIRLKAVRQGKIIRRIDMDGREKTESRDFKA